MGHDDIEDVASVAGAEDDLGVAELLGEALAEIDGLEDALPEPDLDGEPLPADAGEESLIEDNETGA